MPLSSSKSNPFKKRAEIYHKPERLVKEFKPLVRLDVPHGFVGGFGLKCSADWFLISRMRIQKSVQIEHQQEVEKPKLQSGKDQAAFLVESTIRH